MGVAAPMHGLQRAALGSGRAVSTVGQEGCDEVGAAAPLSPPCFLGRGCS